MAAALEVHMLRARMCVVKREVVIVIPNRQGHYQRSCFCASDLEFRRIGDGFIERGVFKSRVGVHVVGGFGGIVTREKIGNRAARAVYLRGVRVPEVVLRM